MIDIKSNSIFPQNIISGVSKSNFDKFPPFGFSITKAEVYNDSQISEFRKSLANQINIESNKLIIGKQTHSDIINIVDENYFRDRILLEGDGLITNLKKVCLGVSIADCAGILMYDPVKEIIAAVHSGWKGTQQNIVTKAIEIMNSKFDVKSENILVYISPSASVENYEVSQEFLTYFPNEVFEFRKNKIYFDNKKMLKIQLLAMGVNDQNIEISNDCTIADQNYHSFRRDKSNSARNCAFIMMN